jgi:hypothetical protein
MLSSKELDFLITRQVVLFEDWLPHDFVPLSTLRFPLFHDQQASLGFPSSLRLMTHFLLNVRQGVRASSQIRVFRLFT